MAAKLEYGAEWEAAESASYNRMRHSKRAKSVLSRIWSRMASDSASCGKMYQNVMKMEAKSVSHNRISCRMGAESISYSRMANGDDHDRSFPLGA